MEEYRRHKDSEYLAAVLDSRLQRGLTLPTRLPLDHDAIRAQLGGRCFICGLVSGTREFAHPIVYQDDVAVAFLSKYPTVLGYTIVAPRRHLENVTGDFSIDEYIAFQRVVHRVGEALRRAIPTERLYLLSLGSRQGNSHVHWHVVPIPPGTPFEQQQYAALDRKDYLSLTDAETADLLRRIRVELHA